jgi:Short C-terminal domain
VASAQTKDQDDCAVQAAECESSSSTPRRTRTVCGLSFAARLELSEPPDPRAITEHDEVPGPESVPDRLSRLASMLDAGLLTREEFDRLKAKLITES